MPALTLPDGRFLTLAGLTRLEAEGLTGNVPPPPPYTSETWYVSTTGGATAATEGTELDPWSLAYALAGAGGRIGPTDTILIRGGVYKSVTGFASSVLGHDAANPITFKAYPSETVEINGAIAAFVDTPATAWEPWTAPSGVEMYRSTATYPKQGTYYAGFVMCDLAGGGTGWRALGSYKTLDHLSADTEGWSADTPYYPGPGLRRDATDGRIYIRLDNLSPATRFDEPGDEVADTDPRNQAIRITANARYGMRGAAYNVFEDLTINDFDVLVQPQAAGVVFRRVRGRTTYHAMRVGYYDPLVEDCVFDALQPAETHWLSWGDIKGSAQADYNRKNGIDWGDTTASGGTVRRCIFRDFFDAMLAGGHDIEIGGPGDDGPNAEMVSLYPLIGELAERDQRWADANVFDGTWDDAWQMKNMVYRSTVHHALFLGAGPSHDGAGSAVENEDPGTQRFHHCIIDSSARRVFYGKPGYPASNLGFFHPPTLGTHGSPTGWSMPWKMWNCTIIKGEPNKSPYLNVQLFGVTSASLHHDEPHEVYNCIIVSPSGIPIGQTANVVRGTEVFDGNVYWHFRNPGPAGYTSIWRTMVTSAGSLSGESPKGRFMTAALVHAAALADSDGYYAPGWDASSLSVDPLLDADYSPLEPACLTGAVDLTAKDWDGTETYEAYRGAVAPVPE